MKKIVYLFGAGASRQALPIINEIPTKIQEIIDIFEADELQLSDKDIVGNIPNSTPKRDFQKYLVNDFKWILAESKRHASIDTFAKKLFVKHKFEELKRLKIALSIIFICLQIKNKPDDRYDSFFASLLQNDVITFPSELRILSWNYDYQFELAFSEYSDSRELNRNRSILNIVAKYEKESSLLDIFSIFKLNGTTNIILDKKYSKHEFLKDLPSEITIGVIEEIIKVYALCCFYPQFNSALSFAWEEEVSSSSIVGQALKATSDASVLVVIGYSFPFFNRGIDRQIVANMKNLEKVYFQAPDANVILERFQAIRDNIDKTNLIPKFDTGQFLIPNEL